jgi:superoxide reductase
MIRKKVKEFIIMEQKFFICEHCGNIIAMVKDAGVPVVCCGQNMSELVPGTVDAAAEKHVPSYEVKGNMVYVTVGEVEHPMLDAHYIEWISLQTTGGNQRKGLKPGDAPKACFAICEGDEVEAVYAYCNLHGLWKA